MVSQCVRPNFKRFASLVSHESEPGLAPSSSVHGKPLDDETGKVVLIDALVTVPFTASALPAGQNGADGRPYPPPPLKIIGEFAPALRAGGVD
jgi:hypothetical protein